MYAKIMCLKWNSRPWICQIPFHCHSLFIRYIRSIKIIRSQKHEEIAWKWYKMIHLMIQLSPSSRSHGRRHGELARPTHRGTSALSPARGRATCLRTIHSGHVEELRRVRVPIGDIGCPNSDSDWFCDLDSLGAPKYQVYSSIIKYHSLSRFWQLDALELHRIPSNSLLGFLLVLGRSDTCIDLLSWSWHLKTLEFNRV